ncbi:MAG: glutamine synthetase family protein [Anaerolineaceae bacterium]|nr:glutamine synthetase family protein [Anaerolineaceae bacterium]
MDKKDLLKRFEEDQIENLWVVYHDYNGRACAKTVPTPKFESVLEQGIVFARANLNFAVNDHISADGIYQAETGDFLAVPDPASYRKLGYLNNTAMVFSYMMTEEYNPFDGCPRRALTNMIKQYAEQDIKITTAFEAEFSLFNKVGKGEYAPTNHDGMFTVTGLNRYAGMMHEIVSTLEGMGIRVEQLGKEYGPSQYEYTVRYETPMQSVDDYLAGKEVVRAVAQKHGVIASFMPKPYENIPGNGLHIHIALWDHRTEENIMAGGSLAKPLSETGNYFVGGLLSHAAGLSGAGSPTVNSYKRLLPGSWAPAHVVWGVGNRGALVRIPDVNMRCRAEYRAGDNTCNPYIYLCVLLAAGLDGIDRQLDPGQPFNDVDVGQFTEADMLQHGVDYLPRTLPKALDALEKDPVLMRALGPVIGQEFLKVKRLELESYNPHVHPWEREMYLEIT